MTAVDQPPALNAQLTKIPIAQLSPTLEQPQEKCIEATVTLVWPYSSSTKSLSLLLAEPDFRLRRLHGQVKAIFHGRVAEQVALSHVGIGDTICLSLKDSNFIANDTATQTPGRYVAWDIHFDHGLSLEINRSSKDSSRVSIEYHVPAPQEPEPAPPSTPRVVSTDPLVLGQSSWESPAFLRSGSNTFSSVPRTSLQEPVEEDGFVHGKGRKRPRYSLKRDDWHILDEPMSPQEQKPALNWWEKDSWEKMSEGSENNEPEINEIPDAEPQIGSTIPDGDQANEENASQEQAFVFVKPSLEISGGLFGKRPPQPNDTFQQRLMSASHLPTDTPQLRPVPSPGLPIPSPIVSNSNNDQGYFSESHTVSQIQNAEAVSLEADASVTASEPIHFSTISPVSPSRATPIAAEDMARTHQDDESISTPAGLVTHQSPETYTLENAPVESEFDPTESFDSSKHVHDTEMTESRVNIEHVDESLLSAVADQVAAQSSESDGSERTAEDRDDRDMEDMGDSESEAESEAESETGSEEGSEAGSEVESVEDSNRYAQADSGLMLNVREMAGSEPDVQQTGRFTSEGAEDDESVIPSDLSQVEQAHHTRHRSFSEEGSLPAEDEALYYEDEGEDEDIVSGSEVEDQYDEDPDASSDEEPEAAGLPRHSSTQHEVIVLDSDSEDELTSDQPANPQSMHQEVNTYRDSSPQSENEGLDMAEDEESQSEAEYSEDDENEQAEEFGQDDRVHDSDMEDESSVNVLARDYSSQKHSTRESSMHEREDKGDVSDAGSEAVSPKDYHSDNVIKIGADTESVIGLDSGEEKSREVSEIASSREDSASASQIEKAWSGAEPKPSVLRGLDGTYDEISDEVAPSGDIQIGNEAAETTSAQSAWPQLLTADPTQQVNDSQATVNKERMQAASARKSSVVLNEPSPSAPETAPDISDHPSENFMAISLPEQVFSSEDVPHENLAGDHLIVIPTTETSQPEEQFKVTQGETLEAPAVVVSQLPAPDRHAHGLRSKLSYFAPLAALIDHFSALVDTISIVHEVSPIAKATSGPKDYFMTIQLTDPSMAGTVLQAQIFRRYKTAMPVLVEGNAVLLRNLKVRSFDHSITLVSVESSSWAVFDGFGPKAQVNGPPVEYRSEELAYASGLRKWYADFGASMVADHQLQASILSESVEREGSAMISESGSVDSVSCGDPSSSARSSRRSRKSHRQVTIHELRDGRRYTEVGSPSSKESIHELRDGTLYANL